MVLIGTRLIIIVNKTTNAKKANAEARAAALEKTFDRTNRQNGRDDQGKERSSRPNNTGGNRDAKNFSPSKNQDSAEVKEKVNTENEAETDTQSNTEKEEQELIKKFHEFKVENPKGTLNEFYAALANTNQEG